MTPPAGALAVPSRAFLDHWRRAVDLGYTVAPVNLFDKNPGSPGPLATEGFLIQQQLKGYLPPNGVWLNGPYFFGLKWGQITLGGLQDGGQYRADYKRYERKPSAEFAGLGIVHSGHIIAVDVDAVDPETVKKARDLLDTLPGASVEVIGSRGFKRYYFVRGGGIKKKAIVSTSQGFGIDILAEGSFSVAYGHHIGAGRRYVQSGDIELLNCPAEDLQNITCEEIEAFLAAMIPHDDRKSGKRDHDELEPRDWVANGDSFTDAVNEAALTNVSAWVPALFGSDARRDGNGYRARRIWDGFENFNISIRETGIFDHGAAKEGFSAVGLVERVRGCEWSEAADWLSGLLGLDFENWTFERKAKAIADQEGGWLRFGSVRFRLPAGKDVIAAVAGGLPGIPFTEEWIDEVVEPVESIAEITVEPLPVEPAITVQLENRESGCSIDEAKYANEEAMRRFESECIPQHRAWVDAVERTVLDASAAMHDFNAASSAVAEKAAAFYAETSAMMPEEVEILQREVFTILKAKERVEVIGSGAQTITKVHADFSGDDLFKIQRLAAERARGKFLHADRVKAAGDALSAAHAVRDAALARWNQAVADYRALAAEYPIYLVPAYAGTGKTRALGQILMTSTELSGLYVGLTNGLLAEVEENNAASGLVARYGQSYPGMCKRPDDLARIESAGGDTIRLCSECPFSKIDQPENLCEYQRRRAAAHTARFVAISHATMAIKAGLEVGGSKEARKDVDLDKMRRPFDFIAVDEDVEGSLGADHVWVALSRFASLLRDMDATIAENEPTEGDEKKSRKRKKDDDGPDLRTRQQAALDWIRARLTIAAHGAGHTMQPLTLSEIVDGSENVVGEDKVIRVRNDLAGKRFEDAVKGLAGYRAYLLGIVGGEDFAAAVAAGSVSATKYKHRIAEVTGAIEILGILGGELQKRQLSTGYLVVRKVRGEYQIASNNPKPFHRDFQRWEVGDLGEVGGKKVHKPKPYLVLNAFPWPDEVMASRFSVRMPKIQTPTGEFSMRTHGKVIRLVDVKPRRADTKRVVYYPDAPSSASKTGTGQGRKVDAETAGNGKENRADIWAFMRRTLQDGQMALVVGSKAVGAWIDSAAVEAGLSDRIECITFPMAVGRNQYKHHDHIFVVGEGTRPPDAELAFLASLTGEWPAKDSQKVGIGFARPDGSLVTVQRYRSPIEKFSALQDADVASRTAQAIERIRSAEPSDKPQTVHVLSAAVTPVLPDDVVVWAEVEEGNKLARQQEIKAGCVTRNMDAMAILRPDLDVTEWEVLELLGSKTQWPMQPLCDEENLSLFSYGATSAIGFCSKKSGSPNWSKIFAPSEAVAEEAKAMLRAAGWEIEGSDVARTDAGDLIPMSETGLLSSVKAADMAEAKRMLRRLKANPPATHRMIAVAWIGGGKSSAWLIPAEMSDEAAAEKIAELTGRAIKSITAAGA